MISKNGTAPLSANLPSSSSGSALTRANSSSPSRSALPSNDGFYATNVKGLANGLRKRSGSVSSNTTTSSIRGKGHKRSSSEFATTSTATAAVAVKARPIVAPSNNKPVLKTLKSTSSSTSLGLAPDVVSQSSSNSSGSTTRKLTKQQRPSTRAGSSKGSIDTIASVPIISSPPRARQETARTAESPARSRAVTQERSADRNRSHDRRPSQKAMLSTALQKANTAVKLDNANNYVGAIAAYSDACDLLTQVMDRAGADEDRMKLQSIRDCYLLRVNELKTISPSYRALEKDLPARPLTEEFTDQDVDIGEPSESDVEQQMGVEEADDDFSRDYEDDYEDSSPVRAPMDMKEKGGGLLSVNLPPPRRDSLLPAANVSPTIPPMPSPTYAPFQVGKFYLDSSPSRNEAHRENVRTLGDAQFSLDRAFGSGQTSRQMAIANHRRSASSGGISLASTLPSGKSSPRSSQGQSHSRTGSDGTTSWLNTIEESSGASIGSEASSRVSASRKYRGYKKQIATIATFDSLDDDVGAEIDAAIGDAYDDPSDNDFSNSREDDDAMLRDETKRRLEIERARERVRLLELEFERDQERQRQRQLSRDAEIQKAKEEALRNIRRPSEPESDDLDEDEDEDERMLEEITKEFILDDLDFDVHTKSALPRESVSSGHSGITWASSTGSNAGMTGMTSLQTVEEMTLGDDIIPAPPAPLALPSKSQVSSPPMMSPPVAPATNAGVRSRRLSGLGAPLKIETSSNPQATSEGTASGNQPAVMQIEPVFLIPRKPQQTNVPVVKEELVSSPPVALTVPPETGKEPSSANSHPGPHQQFVVENSLNRPASPAKLQAPFVPGGLRQIQSSQSLKSRSNIGTPDSPMTPIDRNASTTSLRLPLALSGPTSATTPIGQPLPTGGLPTGGMHLFDSKIHSPTTPGSPSARAQNAPLPLETCPSDPLARPFWLMRCLYQTMVHARGGYLSPNLFVPREVWFIKGVKIKAVDEKIAACDNLTSALVKVNDINRLDTNSLLDEMTNVESIMDKVASMLTKKLGSEVGVTGASAMLKSDKSVGINESGGDAFSSKASGSGSGGKNILSWKKLRTKSSGTALNAAFANASNTGSDATSVTGSSISGLSTPRGPDAVSLSGPHGPYLVALTRLFETAQILDSLFQLDTESLTRKAQIGLDLSQRHAAEFFSFYICRFVLADVSLLLDKFVKRGTEWVIV